MPRRNTRPRLSTLPPELREEILSYLVWADIANLRLLCSEYSRVFLPKGDRVFVSANRLDIQVLRAVADNEILRYRVWEIVWDDSRFQRVDELHEGLYHDSAVWTRQINHGKVPYWFAGAWEKAFLAFMERDYQYRVEAYQEGMLKNFSEAMPMDDAWRFYLKTWLDQERVMAANEDMEAFRYALKRFPNLNRLVVTPSAHGYNFAPRYRTPAMRNFPHGFIYPEPISWPTSLNDNKVPAQALSWTRLEQGHGSLLGPDATMERFWDRWRGFRAAIRIVAEENHPIVELDLSAYNRITGINCNIFRQDCAEYRHLCQILSTPGFRRFEISVQMDNISTHGYSSLKRGLFRDLLARAPNMRQFHLYTTHLVAYAPGGEPRKYRVADPGDCLPLHRVIPLDCWPKLMQLRLGRVVVSVHDLIEFLKKMPSTLIRLELDTLMYRSEGGHRRMVRKIRDELDWRQRPAKERPSIGFTYIANIVHNMRYISASGPVARYVYGNARNPFRSDFRGCHLKHDSGAVEVDVLDRSFLRPAEDFTRLAAMGYLTSPTTRERMKEVLAARGFPARLAGDCAKYSDDFYNHFLETQKSEDEWFERDEEDQ
ncbi:hypothetical protein PWT90_05101 [Aphanocladium album]|nr:hypothetical protein PWT90_05101 [Aphanocladium album]